MLYLIFFIFHFLMAKWSVPGAWGVKCVACYHRVGAWHDVEIFALCDEEYVVPAPCPLWDDENERVSERASDVQREL